MEKIIGWNKLEDTSRKTRMGTIRWKYRAKSDPNILARPRKCLRNLTLRSDPFPVRLQIPSLFPSTQFQSHSVPVLTMGKKLWMSKAAVLVANARPAFFLFRSSRAMISVTRMSRLKKYKVGARERYSVLTIPLLSAAVSLPSKDRIFSFTKVGIGKEGFFANFYVSSVAPKVIQIFVCSYSS